MKIKYLFKKNNIILKNIFSLSLVNVINSIIPLVIVPYLLNVLGTENFGRYSFVNSINIYVLIITTFGFNISATKIVSKYRNKRNYLNLYYNTVILIRILLTILVLLPLFFITYYIPSFENDFVSFLFSIGIYFGDIFISLWFFQGVEKMKYIAVIFAIQKLLYILLVFVFIKDGTHYSIIFLLNSITYILVAIITFFYLHKKFKIIFFVPKYKTIKKYFISSLSIFFSTLGISLYRNINIIILGIVSSSYEVGIYSAAEKIVKSFQSITLTISNALFPHISYIFKNDNVKNNLNKLFKLTVIFFITLFVLTLSFFILSNFFALIINSNSADETALLLKIMSFVVLFGGLNYLLGIIGLINLNYENKFTLFVYVTGLINIILTFLLSYYYSSIGTSISFVLSEFILLLLILNQIYKIKLNYK